jgi:hypothetical protein
MGSGGITPPFLTSALDGDKTAFQISKGPSPLGHISRDLYPSVPWHKSLRHLARAHPSTLCLSSVSVRVSQEEEVLCYRRATSTLSKEFMTTDLPFPSMSRRVAASQLITGHMYRHMIFVAQHTATCPYNMSRHLCLSGDGP